LSHDKKYQLLLNGRGIRHCSHAELPDTTYGSSYEPLASCFLLGFDSSLDELLFAVDLISASRTNRSSDEMTETTEQTTESNFVRRFAPLAFNSRTYPRLPGCSRTTVYGVNATLLGHLEEFHAKMFEGFRNGFRVGPIMYLFSWHLSSIPPIYYNDYKSLQMISFRTYVNTYQRQLYVYGVGQCLEFLVLSRLVSLKHSS